MSLKIYHVILYLMLLCGCAQRLPSSKNQPLRIEQILQVLNSQNESRHQISGTFFGRDIGIKQFLGGVNLDIIAQKPNKLYLAIHSFFGQPSQVFTTNGQLVSQLIYSQDLKPQITTSKLNEKSLQELLPLYFSPGYAVQSLLGVAVMQKSNVVSVDYDKRDKSYTILYADRHKRIIRIEVDAINAVILSKLVLSSDNKMLHKTQYSDFKMADGQLFAHAWVFWFNQNGQIKTFKLQGKDITLNGRTFGPKTFILDEQNSRQRTDSFATP